MASSSSSQKLKLAKTIKGHLHNDREAIKIYVDYLANAKVNTGAFSIFGDFPFFDLIPLFNHNEVLSLTDSPVCYPKLVKMFYANINCGFYWSNEDEIWSSVNGMQIVLDFEILGQFLKL